MSLFAADIITRSAVSRTAADAHAALIAETTLPGMTARFAEIMAHHDCCGHICLDRMAGPLFGDSPELAHRDDPRAHKVRVDHWDSRQVQLVALTSAPAWSEEAIARLSLLATVYVHHGLTMLDCEDWRDDGSLTDMERLCLAHLLTGQCHLEIGEYIQQSPHVVDLHLRRASAKLGSTNFTEAAARAAALGQLGGIAITAPAA